MVVRPYAVGYHAIKLAGKIHRTAMRQMAALGETHAQNRVARINEGEIGGDVGLTAGMRLHVSVIGVKQTAGALTRQFFGLIDVLAAAVVALGRVSFRIFV